MIRRQSPVWLQRTVVMLSVLAFSCAFMLDLARMRATLPYPQQVDEWPVLVAGSRILKTGDLNPREYHYPSLPIYIATASLALGLVAANSQGPDAIGTGDIGRLFGSYYEQPTIAAAPRTVWTLLGALTIWTAAALAWSCSGALGLALATVFLLLGTTIRGMASSYVNVDTPLCLSMALCMLHLARSEPSQRVMDRVGLPAVLCGAALASKYTGIVLVVPCLLSIALWSERDRIPRCAGLLAGTLAAFVLFCPYFALDLPHFLDGAVAEVFHYGVAGHRGHNVEPGFPQLIAYANDLRDEYGVAVLLLAAVGVFALARENWRRALVLVSLPAAVLALLCRQKVHFTRNGLPLEMIVPVFAAAGCAFVFRGLWVALLRLLARRFPRVTPLSMQLMAAVILGAPVLSSLPIERALASYRVQSDTRNAFVTWSKTNMPRQATLVVSTSMPFAPTTVRPELNPQVLDLRSEADTLRLAVPGNYMLLPHWNLARGWAAEQLARIEAGLRVLPRYEVIKRFDGQVVIPAKKETDTRVNPGFDVVRFNDTAKP